MGESGTGPQTSTATVAAVGYGKTFDRGRDLASRLGLTPREDRNGCRKRLGSITKRGNRYFRTLLVVLCAQLTGHAREAPRRAGWVLGCDACLPPSRSEMWSLWRSPPG